MSRKDDQGRRLCTAHTKAGKPCRAPAINGGMVCRMHGGGIPEVKAKAARVLLEELVGPVLAGFKDMFADPATPAAVRVTIGRDILDRTGHKPVIQVEAMPTVKQVTAWIEEAEAEGA